MDPLSDLLRIVRLDGAYFYGVQAREPWSAEALPAKELSPRIMPASDHLISYHILREGRCYAWLVGGQPVELIGGDVIVFPHGDAHVVASEPGLRGDLQTTVPSTFPFTMSRGDEGPLGASLFCGFLGCDRRPFNPLLAALPAQIHMRGMSNAWLGAFIDQTTHESRGGHAGADSVLTRLAELMFIDVLRRHLEELPPGQSGWLAGLRDDVVGQSLTLLHSRPGHPWTLGELARESATSRSILAKRFTDLVGQPPMQYLAQWRMQVAANLLNEGRSKVAAVAAEVGYDSEAAFSRAFKKATGLAPGAWRGLHRGERP